MKREETQQFNAGPYVSYIWSIADDWLRDVYVPSDYRKVILPMVVLRRLDLVLEPTKAKVLEMKRALDVDKVVEQDDALCGAAGQNFCNSSPFTMRELTSRTNPQKLEADFTKYLDGLSANVQEIIRRFEFRNQIPKMLDAGILHGFFEKEVKPYVPDAWVDKDATKIGYEISFTKYFYKPVKLKELAEIAADLKAVESEAKGLLAEVLG